MKIPSPGACVGSPRRDDSSASPGASGTFRAYVPAARSGEHRVPEPPRLRRTGAPPPLPPPTTAAAPRRLPPLPVPARPPVDDPEGLDDTRPMPKRTREEFMALRAISAALDSLAVDATPWQVASRCASAVAEALEAHAVVVLHHDEDAQEARIIGLHGPRADGLLGSATRIADDYLFTAVLTNETPVVLRLDGTLPRFLPERHRALGGVQSLTAFPVLRDGRCVGVVELLDVAEERRRLAMDGCGLVARRLAVALGATEALPAP